MSALRGLVCDGGCGASITWARTRGGRFLLKSEMEKEARARGWHAPDKIGRHLCPGCRRWEGLVQWWRRENVRRGLDAGYGLGKCECGGQSDTCSSAGHPGVIPRDRMIGGGR